MNILITLAILVYLDRQWIIRPRFHLVIDHAYTPKNIHHRWWIEVKLLREWGPNSKETSQRFRLFVSNKNFRFTRSK